MATKKASKGGSKKAATKPIMGYGGKKKTPPKQEMGGYAGKKKAPAKKK